MNLPVMLAEMAISNGLVGEERPRCYYLEELYGNLNKYIGQHKYYYM